MIANNRVWTMGALLITGVVLVAGWFLGVSPMLSQAAASASERADALSQNAAHEVKLASLKQRFESLETLKAALAGQRRLVPAGAELPALVGQLSRIQTASSVVLTDFTVSDAVAFVPPVTEAPGADGSTDVAALPTENASAASSSLVNAKNFVAIPVSVSAVGTFDQVMSFVSGIQNGERLFLMTNLSVVEETKEGSFTGDLSGYVYVLIDQAPSADTKPVVPAEVNTTAAD